MLVYEFFHCRDATINATLINFDPDGLMLYVAKFSRLVSVDFLHAPKRDCDRNNPLFDDVYF